MTLGRIDTHHHFFPKVFVEAGGIDAIMAQYPGTKALEWSVEADLEMMDKRSIAEAILSVAGVAGLGMSATVLRKCNEAAAEMRHTGRFGSFANLPLPDVDASLSEVAYSLDTLKADGFIVFASYDGCYLGDPLFTPLWEELNRRHAVVFVHPNDPTYLIPHVAPAAMLEYPFETTRTAVSLIQNGAIAEFPNIRFILSHAGGTLPYLFTRVALSLKMIPGVLERIGDVGEAFRSFYYDTALAAGRSSFAALSQIASPERVLFGTDYPMAPAFVIDDADAELEELSEQVLPRAAIYRTNAALLLGRGV